MDDPFDLKNFMISAIPERRVGTPAKIQKRRKNFVMVPINWWEKLEDCRSAKTILLAIYLLHLHWKNRGKPFKLPNGMLEYDGTSRRTKWRALPDLEQRGLITVERRRSPIIHVHLEPQPPAPAPPRRSKPKLEEIEYTDELRQLYRREMGGSCAHCGGNSELFPFENVFLHRNCVPAWAQDH